MPISLSTSNILHIIPNHVFSHLSQGSYKDVVGRIAILQNGSKRYEQLLVSDDAPSELGEVLELYAPTHVLIEYSYYPRILSHIRMTLPEAFVAIRPANIEALQHFDNYGLFPSRGPVWLFYGMLRLFWADMICRRKADKIYPITEWESHIYWERLPGSARVEWLPYFTPEHQVSQIETAQRQNVIACTPGIVHHRRNRDSVRHFIRFAEIAKQVCPKYEFVITGDLKDSDLEVPGFISLPGMIDDIAGFLRSVKAIAILSPLGYGFKTSIADALSNNCGVLLNSLHYKRSSALVKELCVEVKDLKPSAVAAALKSVEETVSSSEVNAYLRNSALSILEMNFGLTPDSTNSRSVGAS